jgi:hypothetical protein
MGMDVLAVVDRAMRCEREAAAIYERFATLFRGDPGLRELWADLAAEERSHFAKLGAWRTLLAREPAARRPIPSGYDASLADLEQTLAAAGARACEATTLDQAFAVALDLESSEIDDVYTELLHASPLAREPDLDAFRRREIGSHHARLVAAVRERSTDEDLLLRAEILGAEQAEHR